MAGLMSQVKSGFYAAAPKPSPPPRSRRRRPGTAQAAQYRPMLYPRPAQGKAMPSCSLPKGSAQSTRS